MASALKFSVASAPFNNESADADVILRSADSCDFYVHKVVLRIASPFFAGMFTLPQPADEGSALPIIPITEHSQTVDRLLRLSYPVQDPVLADVKAVRVVLEAAIKYEMLEVIELMKRALSSFCMTKPLLVFVVACVLQLESEAREATDELIRRRMQSNQQGTERLAADFYISELDEISAGAYFRLLRHICDDSDDSSLCKPLCLYRPPQAIGIPCLHPFDNPSQADIVLRSSNDVHFYVNKLVLDLASVTFGEHISQLSAISSLDHDVPDGPRVVSLPEDGSILAALLQLCYPMADPLVKNLLDAYHLLESTTKYNVPRALAFAKRRWMERVETEPFRVFFVAMQNNWAEEAKEAAIYAVYEPRDRYLWEMDQVSAAAYRRFLLYRRRCRRVITTRTVSTVLSAKEEGVMYWSHKENPRAIDNKFWLEVHKCAYKAGGTASIDFARFFPSSVVPRALGPDVNDYIDESRKLVAQITDALLKIKF